MSIFLGAVLLMATPAFSQALPVSPRPLLIQGALRMETSRLIANLKGVKIETIGAWTFWRGTVDGYPVIVSRTRMGASHAAATTALAIERYHPQAIINQGTAGGHDPTLRVGDIVLGTSAVSLAAFKTPQRVAESGSNAVDWVAIDLTESERDDDGELHEGQIMRVRGDAALLTVAKGAGRHYPPGRVVEGVIGPSDVWNEEIDRITKFRRAYGSSVEEMETTPAAQISKLYNVPLLGIRVVTANITNGGKYDPTASDACQDFVLQVVRSYVAMLKR